MIRRTTNKNKIFYMCSLIGLCVLCIASLCFSTLPIISLVDLRQDTATYADYEIPNPINFQQDDEGFWYCYLGEYPQDWVGSQLNTDLENYLENSSESLKETGNSYTTDDQTFTEYVFFQNGSSYNGKYVRVKLSAQTIYALNRADNTPYHSYGIYNNDNAWFKVEPIKWYIYDNTNPTTLTSSTRINLISHVLLTGGVKYADDKCSWQESSIIKWLNSSFLNASGLADYIDTSVLYNPGNGFYVRLPGSTLGVTGGFFHGNDGLKASGSDFALVSNPDVQQLNFFSDLSTKYRVGTSYHFTNKFDAVYSPDGSVETVVMDDYPLVRPLISISYGGNAQTSNYQKFFKDEYGQFYTYIGRYPQTYVGNTLNQTLENALQNGTLSTSLDFEALEATYNGVRYARVLQQYNTYAGGAPIYSTGEEVGSQGDPKWFKVEPIKWYVLNGVDPSTYTTTTKIELMSYLSLSGVRDFLNSGECNSWGESTIRNWLNSYQGFGGQSFLKGAEEARDYENSCAVVKRNTIPGEYTSETSGSSYATTDNVWLPSYYEIVNEYTGEGKYISSNTYKDLVYSSYNRGFGAISDFAIATGCFTNACWLRSPADSASQWFTLLVNGETRIRDFSSAYATIGLRPCITYSYSPAHTLVLDPCSGSFTSSDLMGTTWDFVSSGPRVQNKLAAGSKLGYLPSPTRYGYDFAGWYSAPTTGSHITSSNVMPDQDATLYAHWSAQKFKLTANANGGTISATTGWSGTGTTASKQVAYDTVYGTLPVPTRTGYSFAGWWTSASGGTQISATTKMGAANVIIYAHWTINSYTLTADCNGGSAPNTVPTGWTANGTSPYRTLDYNATYGTLPEPTRQGYIFAGWFTEASAGSEVNSSTKMGAASVTIYAHWVESWVKYMSDTNPVLDTNDGYYKIDSAEKLARLAYLVNYRIDSGKWLSYKYKQTADIDLSAHYWQPIGVFVKKTITTDGGSLTTADPEYAFTGVYDGKIFDIHGMKTYSGANKYDAYSQQGVFGTVSQATIRNVNAYNVNVQAYTQSAAIAGYVGQDSLIENCRASGLVNVKTSGGGLVGTSWGQIRNCENMVNVSGTSVGGIVGYQYEVAVENCVNYGSVVATNAAGIMYCGRKAIISNCVNFGKIEAVNYAGGIAGANNEAISMTSCVNNGTVSGTIVGGIISTISILIYSGESKIEFCVNTGTITNTSTSTSAVVGGIMAGLWGEDQVTIQSCFVNCVVSAYSNVKISAFVETLNQNTNTIIQYCGANIALTMTGSSVSSFYGSVGSGATIICNDSYSLINNNGTQVNRITATSSGMDGKFGIVSSIHDGLPVPLGIYHVSQYGTTTGIADALKSAPYNCTTA